MSWDRGKQVGSRRQGVSNYYEALSAMEDYENPPTVGPSRPLISEDGISHSSAQHISAFPNFCQPMTNTRPTNTAPRDHSTHPALPDLNAVSPYAQRYHTQPLSVDTTFSLTIQPDPPPTLTHDQSKPTTPPAPSQPQPTGSISTLSPDAPVFFYSKHNQPKKPRTQTQPAEYPNISTSESLNAIILTRQWNEHKQLGNITHTDSWLQQSNLPTTQKFKQHTAASVSRIPVTPQSAFFPDMQTIRVQTQRLSNLLEICGTSDDTTGRYVRARADIKAPIARKTQLGLYLGHLRDQPHGKHAAHLPHPNPDCPQYLDCTPPTANSMPHILALMNEYIWVDDDIDTYPSRNNTFLDFTIPSLISVSATIRALDTLWLYYGDKYDWDHLLWELVTNAISVISDILTAYTTMCIVPQAWFQLLADAQNAHQTTLKHKDQAVKLYRSISHVPPSGPPTDAHLIRLIIDIVDNTRYPADATQPLAPPPHNPILIF